MPNAQPGLLSVIRRLAVLAGIGVSAGCSSLIERSSPPPSKIFPGVRLDFEMATVSSGHWDGPGTLPFRCVWATLDLPFSLALDTVLLPWDAAMAWEYDLSAKRAEQRARRPVELAERGTPSNASSGGRD